MDKLPESIGVFTFNPNTNKNILNILKEYFKCMPHILYALDGIDYYIVPHTKIMTKSLDAIYKYTGYGLNIDIFRGAIYEYSHRDHTYNIDSNAYHKDVLPPYIKVYSLNAEKLGLFSED